jgi:hypothetical protein
VVVVSLNKLCPVLFLLVFIAFPAHSAIDDPYVWYDFETPTIGDGNDTIADGEIVRDQSGNGRDGLFKTGEDIGFTSGFTGEAPDVGSAVSYVRTTNDYFSGEATISLWISQVPKNQKDPFGSDGEGHFFNNGSNDQMGWFDGSDRVVETGSQSGFITFVFGSDQTEMYVGSTLVDTGPTTSSVSEAYFAIGGKYTSGGGVKNDYNFPFDQYIAYDRALEPNDVERLASGESPVDGIKLPNQPVILAGSANVESSGEANPNCISTNDTVNFSVDATLDTDSENFQYDIRVAFDSDGDLNYSESTLGFQWLNVEGDTTVSGSFTFDQSFVSVDLVAHNVWTYDIFYKSFQVDGNQPYCSRAFEPAGRFILPPLLTTPEIDDTEQTFGEADSNPNIRFEAETTGRDEID